MKKRTVPVTANFSYVDQNSIPRDIASSLTAIVERSWWVVSDPQSFLQYSDEVEQSLIQSWLACQALDHAGVPKKLPYDLLAGRIEEHIWKNQEKTYHYPVNLHLLSKLEQETFSYWETRIQERLPTVCYADALLSLWHGKALVNLMRPIVAEFTVVK